MRSTAMLQNFKAYFESTTPEQRKKDWEDCKNPEATGPTCAELITTFMKCDGECSRLQECTGTVVPVTVIGGFCGNGMEFNYCETAIETDKRNGFIVIKDSDLEA